MRWRAEPRGRHRYAGAGCWLSRLTRRERRPGLHPQRGHGVLRRQAERQREQYGSQARGLAVAGRGIEAGSRPRAMISAPRKTRMCADPWRHQVPSASCHTLMAWPRRMPRAAETAAPRASSPRPAGRWGRAGRGSRSRPGGQRGHPEQQQPHTPARPCRSETGKAGAPAAPPPPAAGRARTSVQVRIGTVAAARAGRSLRLAGIGTGPWRPAEPISTTTRRQPPRGHGLSRGNRQLVEGTSPLFTRWTRDAGLSRGVGHLPRGVWPNFQGQ